MPQENSEIMKKARLARDKLVERFINDLDVSLIDIGFSPNSDAGEKKDEIVIRIHMREHWFNLRPEERINIPDEIDGIRVVVMRGDYHLD
jgi:hypothetical protein